MTDRLTYADIARGLELAEQATPRPWEWQEDGNFGEKLVRIVDDDPEYEPEIIDILFGGNGYNAAYMHHACNNYPAALQELVELRAVTNARC